MSSQKYSDFRVKKAENGWALSWEEKSINPMMPASTFETNHSYDYKKMVFEASKGVSMEKALDNALAEMKKMLLNNVEL